MFEGKSYLITGGATGIGFGIGKVLTGYGARVAILQPDGEQARSAAAELVGATGHRCDVRDPKQVEAAFAEALAAHGTIDGVVNNAALTGVPAIGMFLEATPEHTADVLDVNVKGPVFCSQTFARYCVRTGRPGAIVHIASVGAYAAQEGASLYCASKAALTMLAQAMALELAPHGIRVNAVAPGDIFTAASGNIVVDLKGLGATGNYIRRTPLGRRGTAEEIGEAVAFLLSERASFVTGTTLTVDGGFLTY